MKTIYQSLRSLLRAVLGLALLVLLPAIFLYYGLYFLLRGRLPSRVALIAHRGGPADGPMRRALPENTLMAYRRAIELGVDYLESDVQRTRDGALVVMHDATVDRTTNGHGRVKDLTLAEIRALDAGQGEPVPLYSELVALAKSAGVGLLTEAKDCADYPGMELEIVKESRRQDYLEKTIVQSFDLWAMENILKSDPALQVGSLYGQGQWSLAQPVPAQTRLVCPMAEMVLLNPWMVRQAHQAGRKVFVWFGALERAPYLKFLVWIGVDGLIVDEVQEARAVLRR